jgi:hypothetical protein
MDNCPDCGKFMKKTLTRPGGYIQVKPNERWEVEYFLQCKCNKFLIVANGPGDGIWGNL